MKACDKSFTAKGTGSSNGYHFGMGIKVQREIEHRPMILFGQLIDCVKSKYGRRKSNATNPQSRSPTRGTRPKIPLTGCLIVQIHHPDSIAADSTARQSAARIKKPTNAIRCGAGVNSNSQKKPIRNEPCDCGRNTPSDYFLKRDWTDFNDRKIH